MKFVKKYVDDPSLSWEERYARLLAHHEEETAILIENLRALEVIEWDPNQRDSVCRLCDEELSVHKQNIPGVHAHKKDCLFAILDRIEGKTTLVPVEVKTT